MELPSGFTAHVGHIGIRDDSTDFAIVAASGVTTASARFTRSRFAGPSVEVSRRSMADEQLRAVVVVSKNANVATGPTGLADAEELAERVGDLVGGMATDVLVTSTGVIGRPYPMDRVRAYLDGIAGAEWTDRFPVTDATVVASAMMTTDTVPKVAEARVGECRVVGVAKGVGMIEPDMATMLAFVFTDAELPAAELDRVFGSVVDRTFNSLSVDTDTSTSDTAAVLASGLAGPVDTAAFAAGLEDVCVSLTRQLASDGRRQPVARLEHFHEPARAVTHLFLGGAESVGLNMKLRDETCLIATIRDPPMCAGHGDGLGKLLRTHHKRQFFSAHNFLR